MIGRGYGRRFGTGRLDARPRGCFGDNCGICTRRYDRGGDGACADAGAAFGLFLVVGSRCGVMAMVPAIGLRGRGQRVVVGAAVEAERVRAAAQEEQQDAGRGDQLAGESG